VGPTYSCREEYYRVRLMSALDDRPCFLWYKNRCTGQGGLVPLASGRIGGSFLLDDAVASGSEAVELLLVSEEVSVSSGMVANFLRTCFRAGRRMGLL
jgi:hypothetical protein